MIDFQSFVALVAVILSLIGEGIYIVSIYRGQTKPHLYTHFVWAIVSGVAFLAQLDGGAGAGAWVTGTTSFSAIYVTILSFKYGERTITKLDRLCLFGALSAIIPWLLMKDPLLSVLLVTFIDCVAYIPTIRKSWSKPDDEHLATYYLGIIKYSLSIYALVHISWVTAFYPIAIVLANLTLICVCVARRRYILCAK